MHAWYLRELYLNNRLVSPTPSSSRASRSTSRRIRQPLYAVAAKTTIAPGRRPSTMHHVAADKRFVLSSSGHILGIDQPAGDAAQAPLPCRHRPSRRPRAALARSRRRCAKAAGGEDWMAWLKAAPASSLPRPAADERHPALGDAPGTYVLEA